MWNKIMIKHMNYLVIVKLILAVEVYLTMLIWLI